MCDRAELVAVVSMDLPKAFDVIQHYLLLAKLKAYGVGKGSCALLKDYFVRKKPSPTGWMPEEKFPIFSKALFQHVKYARLNGYADDHQIYLSDLDPPTLEECYL